MNINNNKIIYRYYIININRFIHKKVNIINYKIKKPIAFIYDFGNEFCDRINIE